MPQYPLKTRPSPHILKRMLDNKSAVAHSNQHNDGRNCNAFGWISKAHLHELAVLGPSTIRVCLSTSLRHADKSRPHWPLYVHRISVCCSPWLDHAFLVLHFGSIGACERNEFTRMHREAKHTVASCSTLLPPAVPNSGMTCLHALAIRTKWKFHSSVSCRSNSN
jgi:hypothetical protein